MNADDGRLGCRAAKLFIKSSEEQNAIWCMSSEHGEQSFVGAVLRLSN